MYDDIMSRKSFPYYWRFVRALHLPTVHFPYRGAVMQRFDVYSVFSLNIFTCIFLNENLWNSIKISLKFVPKGPMDNILALVQIMAWRRPGDKPLSEPMMVVLPTHICVIRPQWVNILEALSLQTLSLRLAKLSLFSKGRLANCWLTILVKEATGYLTRMKCYEKKENGIHIFWEILTFVLPRLRNSLYNDSVSMRDWNFIGWIGVF